MDRQPKQTSANVASEQSLSNELSNPASPDYTPLLESTRSNKFELKRARVATQTFHSEQPTGFDKDSAISSNERSQMVSSLLGKSFISDLLSSNDEAGRVTEHSHV